MDLRFFVLTDGHENFLSLFRLTIVDEAEQLFADEWQGSWVDSGRLLRYLATGDIRLVEILEQEAKSRFPDAFL